MKNKVMLLLAVAMAAMLVMAQVYPPDASGVSFPLLAPDGTADNPSYSFSGLTKGGLYRSGNNIRLDNSTVAGGERYIQVEGTDPSDIMIWSSWPNNTEHYSEFKSNGLTVNAREIPYGAGSDKIQFAAVVQPPSSTFVKMSADRDALSSGEQHVLAGAAGVRIQTDDGTKPTCDSTNRGYIWRVESGAGVADTFEVCLKNAANTYAWVALASP